MAAWRRQAAKFLPELWDDLDEEGLTPNQVFFALLPFVRSAHERGDQEALRRGYAFAQWCWHQHRAPDLQNAAGVAFYEHLFDDWSLREQVPQWLEPAVREAALPLWERRLSTDQYAEVQRLLSTAKPDRWRELKSLVQS